MNSQTDQSTGSPLFLVTFGMYIFSKVTPSFTMQDMATVATILSGLTATFVMLYKFFKNDKK